MPIDLYYISPSPPCRSVMMTAHLIGVRLNLKMVNVLAGEQMKPEYLKLNPLHTVPTLDDNGFCIGESHAICAYLVQKYASDDKLYPKDPAQRAIVDQRLQFEAATYFRRLMNQYSPVVFKGAKEVSPESVEQFQTALEWFNGVLENHPYAAGFHLTIADLALLSTSASAEAVDNHVFDAFPNIKNWFKRCKAEIGHYEELNGSGAALHGKMIRNALEKAKIK